MNIVFHIGNIILIIFAFLVYYVLFYLMKNDQETVAGFWIGLFMVFGVWLLCYIIQYRKHSYLWRLFWFLLMIILMFLSYSLFSNKIAAFFFFI
ncbi:hypothetical protein D7Z54_32245 [Salibacterium salarium]|uniref:Uncharacterized protein n=1 Tax=Salibacterium salarium TaxID=284579 RepID=A0A3R9WLZ7_9BACI|nr:hypothetical protein D7Z54_32245 [Salibacterium salarium]